MPRPRSAAAGAIDQASPEALFAVAGIVQYVGAVVAVKLFEDAPPESVVWLRALTAATILAVTTRWWRQAWSRDDLGRAALFGATTALMNLCFYLAIDRIPLGKSVVIEFIGPIALAAALTRSLRNSLALALAAAGVVLLSGVEIDSEPLGLVFIAGASLTWAGYIVLGRRVAGLQRGLSGLTVSLLFGSLVLAPFGAHGAGPLFSSPRLLLLCFVVGLLSTVVPYGLDQFVMRRIPTRRFAVLLALLPVSAMVVGYLALGQRPSAVDLAGAALVIGGVVVQEREQIDAAGADAPA